MKLFFSVCISFLIFEAYARPIILIRHHNRTNEAELIKNILINKIHIPSNLISLESTPNPCLSEPDSIVHLCLEGNESMKVVSFRHDIVKRSFLIFNEDIKTQAGNEDDENNQ